TVYIFIIELFPATVTVANAHATPAGEGELLGAGGAAMRTMQLLGLGCVAYFVILALFRMALPKFSETRKLRVEAGELNKELRGLLKKNASRLDDRARTQVSESLEALELKRIEGEHDTLKKQLDATSSLANKHLSVYRKGSPVDLATGIGKPLIAALLIRTVLVEPFYIPTGSMIPTVLIEDRVLVNRFIYGVRIPWLNIVPFVLVRRPAAGDVVVFNNPVDPNLDFIKRVVGVPGDSVELRDDVVFINGVEQARERAFPQQLFHNRDLSTNVWSPESADVYRERIGSAEHLIQQREGRGLPTSGPYVVPEGHVFVMGDNRDESSDSRFGLGDGTKGVQFVPYGNIKGKAMIVWLSLSYGGLLHPLPRWLGGGGLRTERMFLPVR
ncbi:MAG: signal peptidase I, partial [Myxococcaceae bacterium]